MAALRRPHPGQRVVLSNPGPCLKPCYTTYAECEKLFEDAEQHYLAGLEYRGYELVMLYLPREKSAAKNEVAILIWRYLTKLFLVLPEEEILTLTGSVVLFERTRDITKGVWENIWLELSAKEKCWMTPTAYEFVRCLTAITENPAIDSETRAIAKSYLDDAGRYGNIYEIDSAV